jgi:hypothetical protein
MVVMANVSAVVPWVMLSLLAVVAVAQLLQLALTAIVFFRVKRSKLFAELGGRLEGEVPRDRESDSLRTTAGGAAAPESPAAGDAGGPPEVAASLEAGPGEEPGRTETLGIALSPLDIYGQLVGEKEVYRFIKDLKKAFDERAAGVVEPVERADAAGVRFRDVYLSCMRGVSRLNGYLAEIEEESRAVAADEAESKKAALRKEMTRAVTRELLPIADKFLSLWGLPEGPDEVFGDDELAKGFQEIRELFFKRLPAVGIYPEDIKLYETKWDPKRVYEIVGRRVEERVPPDTIVGVERWLFRDKERRPIQKGRVVLSEKPAGS